MIFRIAHLGVVSILLFKYPMLLVIFSRHGWRAGTGWLSWTCNWRNTSWCGDHYAEEWGQCPTKSLQSQVSSFTSPLFLYSFSVSLFPLAFFSFFQLLFSLLLFSCPFVIFAYLLILVWLAFFINYWSITGNSSATYILSLFSWCWFVSPTDHNLQSFVLLFTILQNIH